MASINSYSTAIQARLSSTQMTQAVCRAITDVRRYPYTNVAVADQFARSIAWPLAEMTGRRIEFDKPAFCADVLGGKIDPDNLGKDAEGTFDVGRYSGEIGELREVNASFSVVGAVIREMLAGQDSKFVSAVSENLTFGSISGFVKETVSLLKEMEEEVYPEPDAHADLLSGILAAAPLAFYGAGNGQGK